VPLHCTAHGKALIADFTREDLIELFGTTLLRAYSKRSVTTLDRLARICIKVAVEGVATDDGEFMADLRCVAAPVRDQDGVILASVGISAPITRFPKERYATTAREVIAVAKQISESLAG